MRCRRSWNIYAWRRRGRSRSRTSGDKGWAWLHICHVLVLVGDCAESAAFGRRAVSVANAINDARLRIIANLWLGCASYALGDHRIAIDTLQEALAELRTEEQAGRAPLLQVVVTIRSYLSMFLAELGEMQAAADIGKEAMAVAETMDRPWARMLVCWQVGQYHLTKGDRDAASALFERGLAIGRQWGFARSLAINECARGYTMSLTGRADEGVVLFEENVNHLDRIGFTWLRGRRLTYLGEAYLLAGRVVEAKAAAERALQWSQDRKERGFGAWALRLLGEIAIRTATADDTTAEDLFRQAITLGSARGMRPLVAHCHTGLAKLCRHAGKTQQAHEHFATAASMYREMGMTYWLEQAEREATDG
jgi:tetratricopeptide (TPR) repeat protein